MTTGKDMVSTTVYFTPRQKVLLDALSEVTKVPIAEFVRQGIELFLAQVDTKPEERKRTDFELAILAALRKVACNHCHRGFWADPSEYGCGSCRELRVLLTVTDPGTVEPPEQTKIRCVQCGFLIGKAGPCVDHSPFIQT